MVRRAILVVTTVAALLATVTIVAFQPAYAAALTATFAKVSTWSTGFEGRYTITNGTPGTVTGWRVEFTMPTGTTVGTYWDALLASSSGGRYAFTHREYNGTLAPGASASFGFVASGSGSPTNCTVNGGPCGGGPAPSSAPPSSPPPSSPPPTTAPPTSPPPNVGLPRHAMVGYLHASFANGSGYVRMADVPAAWDIINLAFAEPTSPTSGQLRFNLCPVTECPNVESEAAFIAAVRGKQAQGKKVLISVGGQNGQVQLTTTGARDAFVASAAAIIDRFGLDGIDIDFEGHSLSLNANDTSFRSPTTPVIVNLISALRSLKTRYGSRFVLTMAPETFFVQLGYTNYGPGPFGGDPRAGAYLPVIHALRNDLTLLHVQHYNSGPIMGLDNQFHFMGSADFHIAMADMVLAGFPVRGNANDVFPALRPDQVAIGLPAAPLAGNGFTPVGGVQQALTCLTRNQQCGGYTLRAGPKPALRGLMAWSVNWDRFTGFEFSNSHHAFLDTLP